MPEVSTVGRHGVTAIRRLEGLTPHLQAVVPFVLTILVFAVFNPALLSPGSLSLTLVTLSFVGIVAVGQTLLISTGEFDLSVGAVAALAGYSMAALTVQGGVPLVLAAGVGLGIGVVAGTVNAFVTTRLGVPSFIATIGMLSIARGIVGYLSSGESIYPLTEELDALGSWTVGGLTLASILFLLTVVVGAWFLRRTTMGRYFLATGCDARTAEILGINTVRVKFVAFILVGLLSATAGIVQVAALGSASPSIGMGWELLTIAAVVIGGTSLFGGSATVVGTMLGITTLQLIADGITSIGIETNWQTFVIGVLLVSVAAVDVLRRRRWSN